MKPCVKKYFPDSWRGQTLQSVVKTYLQSDGTVKAYFPRPFQLVGYADITDLPDSPPPPLTSYPASAIVPFAPADQTAFTNMLVEMFIAAAQANAMPVGESNGFTIYDPAYPFSEYFNNFINPGLKPAYYNSFITPPNNVKNFWDAQAIAGDNDATTAQKFRQLCDYTAKQGGKNLYGAPGVYTFTPSNGAPALIWYPPPTYTPNIGVANARSSFFDMSTPPFADVEQITRGYLWIMKADGTVLYGSKTVPLDLSFGIPLFGSGPVTSVVDDWLTNIFTTITGDAPTPPAPTITKWDTGGTLPDQPAFFNAVAYDFGLLALPTPADIYYIGIGFSNNPEPYADDLATFIATHEEAPIFLTIELDVPVLTPNVPDVS